MGFFGENEEILDLLKSIIRVGEIHSVNFENATARVHFPDDDELVSYDMQILHRNTLKNKDYNMPDIGEDVLCLCLPSGLASGFILGSIYAGNITPPENDGDKRTVVFSDGARCSYDRKTSQMDIVIGQTSIMANTESVNVNTSVLVTVTAPDITLDGNVSVSGNVLANGDIVAGNISLQKHVHTGVQTGSGVSNIPKA